MSSSSVILGREEFVLEDLLQNETLTRAMRVEGVTRRDETFALTKSNLFNSMWWGDFGDLAMLLGVMDHAIVLIFDAVVIAMKMKATELELHIHL